VRSGSFHTKKVKVNVRIEASEWVSEFFEGRRRRRWVAWLLQWRRSWRSSLRVRRRTGSSRRRPRGCCSWTLSRTARTSRFSASPTAAARRSSLSTFGIPTPSPPSFTPTAMPPILVRCTSSSSSWASTSASISSGIYFTLSSSLSLSLSWVWDSWFGSGRWCWWACCSLVKYDVLTESYLLGFGAVVISTCGVPLCGPGCLVG